MEIPEIASLYQDFTTVFESNLKNEAKTPRQNLFYLYVRVMASASNLY